ncbi:MAG TPA: hypothetical protein VFB81_12010 [Myxococcales bacterium]|nr:hypothetical protein [Myxococcales bacterium]
MPTLLPLVALIALTAAPAARADEPSRPADWTAGAEIDLFAYVLPPIGALHSLHAFVRPPWLDGHLRLGFGVFGGERYPAFVLGILNSLNGTTARNDGWEIGSRAFAAEAFWDFSGPEGGVFAGVYLALERWTQTRAVSASEQITTQLWLEPALGYRWFPGGQRHLFVAIWAGMGVLSPPLAVENAGPDTFQPHLLFPFGSVHVGYEI